jgi:hypothetical protein
LRAFAAVKAQRARVHQFCYLRSVNSACRCGTISVAQTIVCEHGKSF